MTLRKVIHYDHGRPGGNQILPATPANKGPKVIHLIEMLRTSFGLER